MDGSVGSGRAKEKNCVCVCVCVYFSFILKANRVLSGEVLRTGLRVSVLMGDEPG